MDGLTLTPLKEVYNPKGNIYHAMKKSDDQYFGFGEAYFSSINKGEIKGWKKHTKMVLNLIVPKGAIRFVIYNGVDFESLELSRQNYLRLTVDSGLWLAFQGIEEENILLNLANIEHNPNEAINADIETFDYAW